MSGLTNTERRELAGTDWANREAVVERMIARRVAAAVQATTDRVLGLQEHERYLRNLWRDLADKRIEHGVDWPHVVRTLFRDIDGLAALAGSTDPTPDTRIKAEALKEHRQEWASYIEHWAGAVGPEPPTVERIIRALRGPVPFGVARADALDPTHDGTPKETP